LNFLDNFQWLRASAGPIEGPANRKTADADVQGKRDCEFYRDGKADRDVRADQ
jgi:hypothetical protein